MLISPLRIMCWWGIWTLAVGPSVSGAVSSAARSAQLGALVSPLFTMVYASTPFVSPQSADCTLCPCSLLLFGSGVPTAEKPAAQRYYKMAYPDDGSADGTDFHERAPQNGAWANYRAYRARTSLLLPLPPSVYRVLPGWVKRTVLLDLPMYEWTPEKNE